MFTSWSSTCGHLESFQDFLGLNIHFRKNKSAIKLMGPEQTRNIESFLLIGPREKFKVFSARPSDLIILRSILKMKWCV